ncbi:MAG: hypothetical protein ACFFB0_17185 [Promethearchaeota archaeon]
MESKNKSILGVIFFIVVIAAGITIPCFFYLSQIPLNKTNDGTQLDDPITTSAYTPSGIYDLTPGIIFQCGCIPPCLVNLDYTQFTFVDDGTTLTVQPAMNSGCFMTGSSASNGQIYVSCIYPGDCDETYTLVGIFTDNNTWDATFTATFSGSCMDCTTYVLSITGTRVDLEDPLITDAPSNFTVEYGYTGVSISWTATDLYPCNYTIELQDFGLVAGPSTWFSGTAVSYNIPDGLELGEYFYTVNFTDVYGHFITDTVKMTVIEDTSDPIITNAPSDFIIDLNYKKVNISWTATDTNPNTYTIELQGSGLVAGPGAWSNGTAIIYNVPDGLAVGDYIYTINFTDDFDNFVTDSITLTVEEVTTNGNGNGGETKGIYGYNLLIALSCIAIINLILIRKLKQK